jgi:myo-inositol 2-dehydrogenase/D-chiro-inositol 1-dehydrogenase
VQTLPQRAAVPKSHGVSDRPEPVTKPLRIGVVGLGAVAQAVHLPLLAKQPHRYRIASLCDLSASTRDALGHRYGVPPERRFERAEQLLAAGELDAVAILTSGTHGRLSLDATQLGLPVFCEKPLAYTLAEADELASAGSRLMVGYMKLYDPAVEHARALLAGRPTPRSVEVTVLHPPAAPQLAHVALLPPPLDIDAEHLQRLRAADDAVLERALGAVPPALALIYADVLLGSIVHDLAVIRYLLGGPLTVDDVDVWPDDRADGSLALLGRLPGGTRVDIRWHYLEAYPAYREELRVHDEGGTVELDFPAPYLLHAPTALRVVDADAGAERRSTTRSTVEAFERQWLAFAELVDGGTAPRAGIDEGRADVAVCQAAVRVLALARGVEIGGEAGWAAPPAEPATAPSPDRRQFVNPPAGSVL